jgi:hypothetical protein
MQIWKRRPHPGQDEGLWGLAGWVFADSLLALAVVFLATLPNALPPDPPPADAEITTTSAAPTTEPEPPPAVDSRFVCFRVGTDPALLIAPPSPARDAQLDDIARQVGEQLNRPDLSGRRAGIVLTFGVADQPGDGRVRAEAFNRDILPRFDPAFRRPDGGEVASRAFWDGRPTSEHPPGSISVNIYPLIENGQRPLTPEAQTDC